MKYLFITAGFIGGPYSFGLKTDTEDNLDEKVMRVVFEKYQGADFAPGPITYKSDPLSEDEFKDHINDTWELEGFFGKENIEMNRKPRQLSTQSL